MRGHDVPKLRRFHGFTIETYHMNTMHFPSAPHPALQSQEIRRPSHVPQGMSELRRWTVPYRGPQSYAFTYSEVREYLPFWVLYQIPEPQSEYKPKRNFIGRSR